MRDPKRIDRVLTLIQVLWKKNPDFRLCQLLINVDSDIEGRGWFVEDDDLEARLEAQLEKGTWGL